MASDLDELRAEVVRLSAEVHRLQCDGAFSIERDPFHLMPAIVAYARLQISDSKMRECIRRWLAGANFRDPAQRKWEAGDGE